MKKTKGAWEIVYDAAIRPDGSYFFPEKLSDEYLQAKRKELGTYIFSNQMMNRIIPEGEQDFKKDWLKYYDELPERKNTFCFIDPAISQEDDADFTAVVIIDVDVNNDWYLRAAKRYKITATKILGLIFQIYEKFKPKMIGIESVAYQKALFHFLKEEMRRRNTYIPVHDYHPGTEKTKEDRIRGLVPRFEWGNIFIARGLDDFEDEYLKFPRARHDDLMDALASVQEIAYAPSIKKEVTHVPAANSPEYEKWYIEQIKKGKKPGPQGALP